MKRLDHDQTETNGLTRIGYGFAVSIATVTAGLGPWPVKQMTLAVILPVTIAPEEDRSPILLFVVMVAETRAFPHARPVAVNRPVELTVTISGVFEVQVTWVVMSFVTGGCI